MNTTGNGVAIFMFGKSPLRIVVLQFPIMMKSPKEPFAR